MTIRLDRPLVYVTRDIERALGMEPVGNYFIISNDTPHGREIRKKYPENVWLLESEKMADTYDLLQLPGVHEAITKYNAGVVVFQSNPRIERLAWEKKWDLLNPPATLSREVEEKISQVRWLGEDAKLLPPHKVTTVSQVFFEGKPFILQFNHSHTGKGTYVIDSEKAIDELRLKFPNRECKVVDFIDGPAFTVNGVVAYDVLIGNVSYQITGMAPFTDLPFSTVGNDWALPRDDKYTKVSEEVREMALQIGKRLQASGWRGLYGIDAIYDDKAQKTYLIEINARQPASSTYESVLQKKKEPESTSIFEAHISSFLRLPIKDYSKGPISGSQIVQRVTVAPRTADAAILRARGYTVIEYKNADHNMDLFRIQSEQGIIADHKTLNESGQFIASCIK